MKKTLKSLAATALMALATAGARAEGYIGGSIGHTATEPPIAEDVVTSWNTSHGYVPASCETLGCYSEQDPSVGLKIFAGYRVNPYFAVEGFLAHLGSYDSYAEDGLGTQAWASADVGTLGIAAVGMIPLGSGRVSLLGKLGVHSWRADGDYFVADTIATDAWSTIDESGVNGMGGIGVQIDFGERAAMRVELEGFAAETDYTDFGVGLFSVGGMFRF